jgi:hypothetical protein
MNIYEETCNHVWTWMSGYQEYGYYKCFKCNATWYN